MLEPQAPLQTPVAFIIFNRPDTTARVFAEIARARPRKLLVIADGPRASRAGEAERCARTRAVVEGVDWDCEVLTNYSDTNMGCRDRVASGIDWVFEQVPEAIFLEDDCLPDPTFFRFCEEMLERYRNNERVAMISGDNFLFGKIDVPASYYFSRYSHIWGWASWRRAWAHYRRDAADWPSFRDGGGLERRIGREAELAHWCDAFDGVYSGRIDTWDYQWVLSTWVHDMVSIIPAVNMISNIGFGVDATHTKGRSIFADMRTEPMAFPLRHPDNLQPLKAADNMTSRTMFAPSLLDRVLSKLRAFIPVGG